MILCSLNDVKYKMNKLKKYTTDVIGLNTTKLGTNSFKVVNQPHLKLYNFTGCCLIQLYYD